MTRPLKILQVLPALNSGGVERGCADLNEAIVKAGHHSFVCSSGGTLVSTIESQGGKHLALPVHSKNPLRMAVNAIQLSHLIKELSIDIVHVRSRAPAWSCLWAAKRQNTPVVSTFHGQYGSQNALKRLYNSGMLRTDLVIAVSGFIEQHIRQCYPQYVHKIKTIHRGVNVKEFSPRLPDSRVAQLRETWNLPEQTGPVIMLPGRLTRLKGHETFIRALANVKRPFTALIVGSLKGRDSYANELKTLINQQQLSNHIRLCGDCSDMPSAYALADIVVAASTKPESFGRVACEAQAMEKLVVATAHGGALETVSPQQKEGLCKPNDSQSMAQAINTQLSLSGEAKQTKVESSRQFICEHFALEHMCSRTIEIYQQLSQKA